MQIKTIILLDFVYFYTNGKINTTFMKVVLAFFYSFERK